MQRSGAVDAHAEPRRDRCPAGPRPERVTERERLRPRRARKMASGRPDRADARLPALEGRSGGTRRRDDRSTRNNRGASMDVNGVRPAHELAYDPQTAGGLLVSSIPTRDVARGGSPPGLFLACRARRAPASALVARVGRGYSARDGRRRPAGFAGLSLSRPRSEAHLANAIALVLIVATSSRFSSPGQGSGASTGHCRPPLTPKEPPATSVKTRDSRS
jgi:hypothetical protein